MLDAMQTTFEVSGVTVNVLVPPLVALVVSFFLSMGGVSGAFLLLPFQMSVLGYVTPSVSATNFVYNIVAIPSGVYRYIREGRMFWPMALITIAGTLPGVFLGYWIRVKYLPDPVRFKVFVGGVLLYLGIKLSIELLGKSSKQPDTRDATLELKTTSMTLSEVRFVFSRVDYRFSTLALFGLALGVGVLGGAYGIGGGAIIAPFAVSILRLPVHAVAGAALLGTLVTSLVGVFFYSIVPSELNTRPDWPLGLLFGAGGFVGMYLGARCQRYVNAKYIKIMLALVVTLLAIKYISAAFL